MFFNSLFVAISRQVITRVPEMFLPHQIGSVILKLPSSPSKKMIESLLNSTFSNQISEGDFDFLNDKQLQLEIVDANLFIGISFSNRYFCCTHLSSAKYSNDVTLSINTFDAIRLIEQEIDPDTLFFQRKLKISGNTELAHHVKNTIDTLNHALIPQFPLKLIGLYRKKILQSTK